MKDIGTYTAVDEPQPKDVGEVQHHFAFCIIARRSRDVTCDPGYLLELA